ncbi:ArsA family ATPase [Streptomyces sp. NPDC004609]|uniref:ArsA family ATPase n=1 Tax=Streptomyces sp. NPDC004609 TaxID=3364704 RepID=UPI00367FF90A
MRRVLVTGLGGAGRTTIAAATALAAAGRGRRALFLSTAPGEILGTPLPAEPVEITGGLWAARIDTAADFRAEFLSLQERGASALDLLGAARLTGEELTELPGSEQFALLRALTTVTAGDWDVVVVDMPPLRETIALLALPEQLRRYLRRLLPPERQAARALRPVLAQLAGVPMPAQWLYETTARWDAELAAVQALIESPDTTLRLVAEPGPAAADALRTARPGLALHGLRVDTLVANRVLPRHSPDLWLAGLASQQEKCLHEWAAEWVPGSSLREIAHAGRDPRGPADLALLGTAAPAAGPEDGVLATGLDRPGSGQATQDAIEDRREDDGILLWTIPLPGAVKDDLGLVRRGDELLLTVGPFRRIVPLPSVLRRCTVSGAALADGNLTVRFTPDPELWPRGR